MVVLEFVCGERAAVQSSHGSGPKATKSKLNSDSFTYCIMTFAPQITSNL